MWLTIAACAVVLVLPIAWRVKERRFDPFEPIVLFALAYGAMFVVRPAAMLIRGERFFWGLDVLPYLPRALVLALVGAVAFIVGYELRAGRTLARRAPAPAPIESRVAIYGALATAGVAIVALLVLLPVTDGLDSLRVLLNGRSDDLGELLRDSSTYVLYATFLFAPAALVLIGVALRDRSPRTFAVGAIVLLVALVRVTPVGGRIVLLPLLGGILVLVYVMRGRRPSVPLLTALGLVALVGSFVLLHVRDTTDDLTLGTAADELRDRPQAVLDPILTSADAEMVLALSGGLSVIPDDLGHRWGGATVGNLVTRPIPRELWESKPLPPGQEVVRTVWPQHYPSLDPAFSPLLVLYWDLALPGVALGMALFGLLARLLYAWFLLHRHELGAQLLFAASVWFVVIGARNDPVDTIVLAAFLVGPVAAIVIVASTAATRTFSSEPDDTTANVRINPGGSG
jgi:hypothetical protein